MIEIRNDMNRRMDSSNQWLHAKKRKHQQVYEEEVVGAATNESNNKSAKVNVDTKEGGGDEEEVPSDNASSSVNVTQSVDEIEALKSEFLLFLYHSSNTDFHRQFHIVCC